MSSIHWLELASYSTHIFKIMERLGHVNRVLNTNHELLVGAQVIGPVEVRLSDFAASDDAQQSFESYYYGYKCNRYHGQHYHEVL
jgi:hypothetical protein